MANLSFKSIEYREGYQAYLDGVDYNPYDDEGSREYLDWNAGSDMAMYDCAMED